MFKYYNIFKPNFGFYLFSNFDLKKRCIDLYMTLDHEEKIERYQKYLVKKLMLNTIARDKYIKVVVFNHNHLENQQKLSKYINTLKISI